MKTKKHPFRKKIICSAFTGVIAASCLTAVPASAESTIGFTDNNITADTVVFSDNIIYSTYDVNKDRSVNVFDLLSLNNYILNKSSVSAETLYNNYAVDNAKIIAEQYIKTNCKMLVPSLSCTNVIGFTDAFSKVGNDFLAVVKFNKGLTTDELQTLCKDSGKQYESALRGTSADYKTNYKYNTLRMVITDNQVTTVIPYETNWWYSAPFTCTKSCTNNKLSQASFDINRNGSTDVFDSSYLRNFLMGGNLVAKAERNKNDAINDAVNDAKHIYNLCTNYTDQFCPDIEKIAFVEALMSEPGVVDNDFIVTIQLTEGIGIVPLCDISQVMTFDEEYLAGAVDYDSMMTSSHNRFLRISVIDGMVDTIAPCPSEIGEAAPYYVHTYTARSAPNCESYVADAIAQGARQALKEKSEVIYAKTSDISYDAASKSTTITFAAPLSTDEIFVLNNLDTDIDYSVYEGKVNKVKIDMTSDNSYTITPVFSE